MHFSHCLTPVLGRFQSYRTSRRQVCIGFLTFCPWYLHILKKRHFEVTMPECTINAASEDYADFIYRHNNMSLAQLYESLNAPCIQYINSEYAIVYSPLEPLLPLTLEHYTYSALPKLYTLLDTTSMDSAGILPVFNQPALGSRGTGVLIGFIDTGIDYQNPLFQNSDGTTRIAAIWDQSVPGEVFSLTSPRQEQQFQYGTYYTREQINEALQSPQPLSVVPSTDTDGHGTFLAGIAAGNQSRDFTGAAPDSAIAVVKLKPAKQYLRNFYLIREDAMAFQENDIMAGVVFLTLIANLYQMPLVVCLGLGTNQGSHDGSSSLGRVLDSLGSYRGLVPVCAAGNEVGFRHHYSGMISSETEYEDVEIRVSEEETGFTTELWASPPDLFTVGFVSPTGEVIQRIPFILGNETRVTFSLEDTVITVNYRLSPSETEGELIFMRFENPTEGIWHIRVYPTSVITGVFHIWLPIHGFLSEETVFLRADPYTTIVDPGTTVLPMTIAAYNHYNNSLYIHSSRGFTRTGQIKPDLAAPGVDVYGPGIPPAREIPGTARPGTSQESAQTSYPMIRKTGSSVAAAHTAGAAANLLSWGIIDGHDPAMNVRSVKSYLIWGANRNPAYTYPSREWGYGTLDLYQTFLALRE